MFTRIYTLPIIIFLKRENTLKVKAIVWWIFLTGSKCYRQNLNKKRVYGIGNPVGGVTKLVIPKPIGHSSRGPIVPVATATAVSVASRVKVLC